MAHIQSPHDPKVVASCEAKVVFRGDKIDFRKIPFQRLAVLFGRTIVYEEDLEIGIASLLEGM